MTDNLKTWVPSDRYVRIRTIDAHTGGEPLRIITDGIPEIPGQTILECRQYMKKNLDWIRSCLMWEPRGHHEMYGCIVTPPKSSEADLGVLFMHNEGYSTMCGHGIIALATAAVETGMIQIEEPVTTIRMDTPAGLVTAFVKNENGRTKSVSFLNVPSFVVELDAEVDVPGVGKIRYDLAFGGAYYAYVEASQLGYTCTPEENSKLIASGMAIKHAVMDQHPIHHPFEEELSFLYGTIFIAPPLHKNVDSRNVCIFADGEVDRSPTGTGVSGRIAIHHRRGDLKAGDSMTIESIADSCFTGRVADVTSFGPFVAVIPEVEGSAYITGRHEFLVDPDDPMKNGFLLGY